MDYVWINHPITRILLAGNSAGLKYLLFENGNHCERVGPKSDWTETPRHLGEAIEQVEAFLAGESTEFDVCLALDGTEFQQKVWSALREIPYGETASYGELATAIGQPSASRAVGMANGRNPISIIVPCHRVIGASGKLVGYGGGLSMKQWLLDHEKHIVASSEPQMPARETIAVS